MTGAEELSQLCASISMLMQTELGGLGSMLGSSFNDIPASLPCHSFCIEIKPHGAGPSAPWEQPPNFLSEQKLYDWSPVPTPPATPEQFTKGMGHKLVMPVGPLSTAGPSGEHTPRSAFEISAHVPPAPQMPLTGANTSDTCLHITVSFIFMWQKCNSVPHDQHASPKCH